MKTTFLKWTTSAGISVVVFVLGSMAFGTLIFSTVSAWSWTGPQMFASAEMMSTAIFAIIGASVAASIPEAPQNGLLLRAAKVYMSSFLTANGGGTIRDLLTDRTPFWIDNHVYIVWPLLTAIVVLMTQARPSAAAQVLFSKLDMLATGTFIYLGVNIASVLVSPNLPTFLLLGAVIGTLTSTGGGMIRDLIVLRISPTALTSRSAMSCLFISLLYALAIKFSDAEAAKELGRWAVPAISLIILSRERLGSKVV